MKEEVGKIAVQGTKVLIDDFRVDQRTCIAFTCIEMGSNGTRWDGAVFFLLTGNRTNHVSLAALLSNTTHADRKEITIDS